MKLVARVASNLVPIALFGCATAPQTAVQNPSKVTEKCDFPDAPGTPAPEWVCNYAVDGAEVAVIGTYGKTAAGLDFQMDHAEASARARLAREMRNRLVNKLEGRTSIMGTGAREALDKANSTATNSFTDEELVGARMFRNKVSPGGTMYVLVGFDKDAAARNMKRAIDKAVKSSEGDKNENELWQKVQADQAQEELRARATTDDAKPR
jgi:hypothetical protein